MSDSSGSSRVSSFILRVVKGGNRGKTIPLETGREYVVGRSGECDICVDPSDKMASRKHALLKIGANNVVVQNLSRANPVQVRGKPVTTKTVKPGGEFRVGETVFSLEMPGRTRRSPGFSPDRKVLMLAGLVGASLVLLLFMFTGQEEEADPSRSVTRADPPGTEGTGFFPSPETLSSLPDVSGPDVSGMDVSDMDRKKADAHFRQGMFHYDTGNILRAVSEWERALGFHPEHADARIWFLKAEKELEEMVKNHYQNAMLHYRYMRYDQAVREFRMVLELSRNQNTDQYKNALRYIDELRGR